MILNGVIDRNVEQMMLALPGFEIGDKVHELYVNKLIGSVPGKYKDSIFSPGTEYRKIFFPNWQKERITDQIVSKTDLNERWWSDFSVALLCQSMDYLTSRLKNQLETNKINGEVNRRNAQLAEQSIHFYSLALSQYFNEFKEALNRISDYEAAKKKYIQGLKDNVGLHQIWYTAGQWKNPHWEMFHHFTKLIVLGASDNEIDSLIDQLRDLGLPIPPEVDKTTWKYYTSYLNNKKTIDHVDIDNLARNGILKDVSIFVPGGYMPARLSEGYSYNFTANGEPGNMYRTPPRGGSCFTADTWVLMSDQSKKKISDIHPGDMVATAHGYREVAFVSKPLLHGRNLYQINDLSFAFTESHPFLNGVYEEGHLNPEFLCISPEALNEFSPTFNERGVGTLSTGSRLAGFTNEDPTHLQEIEIKTVKSVQDPTDNIQVFDLILSPLQENNIPQFFVGSEDQFFLVTTEMPLLSHIPNATVSILYCLKEIMGEISKVKFVDDLSLEENFEKLYKRLTLLGETVLNHAVNDVGHFIDPTDIIHNPDHELPSKVETEIKDFLNAVSALDNEQNIIFGAYFETLTTFLVDQIEMVAQLGWRNFQKDPGDKIALSLGALHVHCQKCIVPETRLKLKINVYDDGGLKEQHVRWNDLGRENTPFASYFDQVIYLDTTYTQGGNFHIDFEFYVEDSMSPLLLYRSYLPDQQESFYRRYTPNVISGENTYLGEFHFDLRVYSDDIKEEYNNSALWNELSQLQYASQLGKQIGLRLKDVLAHYNRKEQL
ncbi:hypothetical protein [Alkalihalobacillus sp. AL-G]|uniref:hypothetical protein n=1 Tax=Alkalihalobacillus sp. AL-G TaxID=2926399 RepID=UPI00272B937F|nr:hypothetical protein [Alkalihalobacillus sp. AL-G]WLD92173.1 hypothetical protein MOJ78_14225 [Alkalihalobacillus sp. AL-G]